MSNKKDKVKEAMKESDVSDKHSGISNNEQKTGSENTEQQEPVSAEEETKAEQSPEAIIKELQDKYLRLYADFENYRKRTLKERIDNIKYASEDVLIKLLPVIDDMERAITSMKQSQDIKGIKEGIELIYSKFHDFMKQQGIKEIEALNKDFDPEIHDAISKTPAPEEKLKGKVVDITEKGYILHDKIIRHSKVIVGE